MVHNVHTRTIHCSAPAAGALLDTLSSPGDLLWPTPEWPPMQLDGPLAPGATGGHGPIRYGVSEYEPARRVRFTFAPGFPVDGWHEFRVEPLGDDTCRLVHEMTARPHGWMRLGWPLAIRWLHDALLEDALDHGERSATGTVATPHRWSAPVRALRSLARRRRKRRRGPEQGQPGPEQRRTAADDQGPTAGRERTGRP